MIRKLFCAVLVFATVFLAGCISTPEPRDVATVPVISLGTPLPPSTDRFDRAVGVVVPRYPFLTVSETRPGRHVIDWHYRRYGISGRTAFELTDKAIVLRPLVFNDAGRDDSLRAYDRLMRKVGNEILGTLAL